MQGPFSQEDELSDYGVAQIVVNHEGSGIIIEQALKALRLPSMHALGKVLGVARPDFVRTRYWGGNRSIGGFYLARLFYAVMLVKKDPAYWTPRQLQQIDWKTIHLHPKAIKASPELKKKAARTAKRESAKSKSDLSTAWQGVPRVQSNQDRPLSKGLVA